MNVLRAEESISRPSSARAEPARSRAVALAVIGLTVLAAALRFWRIGHQSYWYDESVTLDLLRRPLGTMLGQLPHVEGTPPLYYCLAWIWTRIFGFGEAGLRSLSAVAGVSVVPVLYGVGSRLMSRRAGLVAAALAACNPLLIWYSQEARAYSLLVAMAALSLLAFAHLLTPSPSGRAFVLWVIASALTLATHYYGLLAVVPQAGWLLWLHRRDRRVWLSVAAVAAAGLALLPLALEQRHNAAWIAEAPLGIRLGQIAPQFLLGTAAPARSALKIAGAVALLLAAVALVLRAGAPERRGALVAGGLAVAGFGLGLVLIALGFDEVITRNLIVVLLAVIVLAAAGLGARRSGALGWAATAALCAIGVIATVGVAVDWRSQRPDWRGVARVASAGRPASADAAVLVENDPSLIPLGDYMPGLYPLIAGGAQVQELAVVAAVKAPTVTFCWWGAACHLPLAPLDTSIHIPGFQRVGPITRVNQFEIYRLRAARPVALTRDEVDRALGSTPLTSIGLFIAPPAALAAYAPLPPLPSST